MMPMTTSDQLRALADRASRGPWIANNGYVSAAEGRDGIAGNCMDVDAEFIAAARNVLPQILDQLDRAEHRIARLEAQTDIRGRAVVIYRERAREAEAQIKAVRELHCSDGHDGTCGGSDCFESCVGCLEDYPCSTIRALDN